MPDNEQLAAGQAQLQGERPSRLAAYRLDCKEQLIEQGQPQFGVFAQVNSINYLDYHSYLISQKPVAPWRKQLKANQFAFIQIVEGPYRLCLAIATIKLATTAFAYLYNEQTKQLEVVEALQPLMRKAQFTGDHQHGQMLFNHADLAVSLQFVPQAVSLTVNSACFSISVELQRGPQPLAVCSPSGRRGWSFTQKEPFTKIDGELILHKHSKHYEQAAATIADNQALTRFEFSQTTLANLDWTLGFMRHETNWFWSCINTQLIDNHHFMLNLSMGVNETGISENACWIDGQIYYLPPVMFQRNASDNEQDGQWSIRNQNLGWSLVDIDLQFTPIEVYKKTDNYGLVASIFEQWLGLYSGYIQMGDQKVVLDKVMGLAEDHFAKW